MNKKENKKEIDQKVWDEYSEKIEKYNFNISPKFKSRATMIIEKKFNNESFFKNFSLEKEFNLIRNFFLENDDNNKNNKKMTRRERRGINLFKTIDLHGMTKFQASEAIIFLINESSNEKNLYVKIITGKGGILQKHIISILRNSPLITKFSFAKEKDGGTGAFYALIKNIN